MAGSGATRSSDAGVIPRRRYPQGPPRTLRPRHGTCCRGSCAPRVRAREGPLRWIPERMTPAVSEWKNVANERMGVFAQSCGEWPTMGRLRVRVPVFAHAGVRAPVAPVRLLPTARHSDASMHIDDARSL